MATQPALAFPVPVPHPAAHPAEVIGETLQRILRPVFQYTTDSPTKYLPHPNLQQSTVPARSQYSSYRFGWWAQLHSGSQGGRVPSSGTDGSAIEPWVLIYHATYDDSGSLPRHATALSGMACFCFCMRH